MDELKKEIEKFLTFPSIAEQVGAKPKFGRLVVKDERNSEYPLRSLNRKLTPQFKATNHRRWRARWYGDQGNTSMCTVFAFLHLFEHEPVNHPRSYGRFKGQPTPVFNPREIYCKAQQIDPWEGGCGSTQSSDQYDGTSPLAVMKVVQELGYISEYHWEYKDVDEILQTVLNFGPVMFGSNWYRFMELRPHDSNTPAALLDASGEIVGGHEYLIDEVDLRPKAKGREIGIFNSWGKDWGMSGRAFMSLDTFEKLLKDDGEVTFATEVP